MDNTKKNDFRLAKGEIKVFPLEFESNASGDFFVTVTGVEGSCLQTAGKDRFGKDFDKPIKVCSNSPVRLWIAVRGAKNEGVSRGKVKVTDGRGEVAEEREIVIETTAEVAKENQFDDLRSLRRLVWLNSDRKTENTATKPFSPVKTKGNAVYVLGREIVFSETGLPKEINSFFDENIKICGEKTEILSGEVLFVCGKNPIKGKDFSLKSANGTAEARAVCENEDFIAEVFAKVDFDGFVSYKIVFEAKKEVCAEDVSLKIPVSEKCRKYFMGLSEKSGYFKGSLDWKWDGLKQQDGFWCGAVNGGVKFKFTGETYRKPLCNIYYAYKPLIVPECWNNGGEGGIKFCNGVFVAYTGKRSFSRGEKLTFCFDMLVTPLKETDYKKQFSMRFYQKLGGTPEEWLASAKESGANVINVHHGTELNPYINYPFFENAALTDFTLKAHKNGIKVKEYYTIRELSVNAPEFEAFRDFGYEIFEKNDKNLKGEFWQSDAKRWIYDNIGKDFIPAWRQEIFRRNGKKEFDASVITNGEGRLCNFYVESLDYLLKNTDTDGIYIDDSAFDRETMKRVRRVLDEREGRLIDFHTWNHDFNDFAGHAKSLFLYMELLPYIDKLWVGEGFEYSREADYWLVEISGIPFGLTGDMLENEEQFANPWKGLLFGMTTRAGWYEVKEAFNPAGIWKAFDEFGLTNSDFIGWWNEKSPVILSDSQVKASVYQTGTDTFIALANFGKECETSVSIIGKDIRRLIAEEIKDLQTARVYNGNKIKIEANGGALIRCEYK